MSKLMKVVAWFSLLNGALTLLTPALIYALRHQLAPIAALAICSVLGIGGLLGGYYGLKAKAWAFWILACLYFIQVAEYFSPTAFITFMGPLAIKIGWGWYSPPSRFNINLLAIAFTVLSFVSALGLTSRSSGRPKPRAA
ncbi:MAG TPA: hypothetical protein VNZ27_05775 [Rhodanobacter sp.]|jgi:hypothetical protein|nr:hypothetical protein [Rhodanobacter sp.]